MENRRPIKARSSSWAQKLAKYLSNTGITPNQISLLSIVFSIIGAYFLLYHSWEGGLIICAICIQLRLICNLLDGMVAIEGNKKSYTGVIFNEFPDRISDTILIVAAGYFISSASMGWLTAFFAFFTAYIRVFSGSLGFKQSFAGPMAKQQRMGFLTAGLLAGQVELWTLNNSYTMFLVMLTLLIGSALTCYARIKILMEDLQKKEDDLL